MQSEEDGCALFLGGENKKFWEGESGRGGGERVNSLMLLEGSTVQKSLSIASRLYGHMHRLASCYVWSEIL